MRRKETLGREMEGSGSIFGWSFGEVIGFCVAGFRLKVVSPVIGTSNE